VPTRGRAVAPLELALDLALEPKLALEPEPKLTLEPEPELKLEGAERRAGGRRGE